MQLTDLLRTLFPEPLQIESGPSASTQEPSPLLLKLGSQVTAQVMRDLGGGQFTIQIDGMPMQAEALAGVVPGQQLRLRVEQLEPRPRLAILSDTPGLKSQALEILRPYLPQLKTPSETLQALTTSLLRISPSPTPDPTLVDLKQWIDSVIAAKEPPNAFQTATFFQHGGLNYESQLRELANQSPKGLQELAQTDLKALLLKALDSLETNTLPAELASRIEDQLAQIEGRQLANLLARLEGQPYRLDLPFPTPSGLSTLSLAIQPEGGHNQTETGEATKGFRILFMLELDGLGHTHIDAFLKRGSLQAAFFVERAEALSVLRTDIKELEERLVKLGYSQVEFNVEILADAAPETKADFEQAARQLPLGLSLIDLVA